MKLRVELEAHDGRTAWAEYDTFRSVSSLSLILPKINIKIICRVEAEDQDYLLHVGGYSGNAGDSMTTSGGGYLNGMKFSTRDRDNDNHGGSHCIDTYKGAWWFNV